MANIKRGRTGGGNYFPRKDKDLNAYAIYIEVRRDAPDDPGGFGGAKTDAFYADYAIFHTEEDLNNGTPEILTNARCDKSLLRRDAIGEEIGVGNAAVKRLGTWKGDRNPRPSFVWRWVEDEGFDKVTDWVYKRDAEVKALTEGDGEGGDDIPEFLK